jgi:hypothetical protein
MIIFLILIFSDERSHRLEVKGIVEILKYSGNCGNIVVGGELFHESLEARACCRTGVLREKGENDDTTNSPGKYPFGNFFYVRMLIAVGKFNNIAGPCFLL